MHKARGAAIGICSVLVFGLSGLVATAQQTAALRGEITDSSGAVLPGVTVVATTDEGRPLGKTLTDAVGRYVFASLPPGLVRLTFRLDGFDSVDLDVELEAGVEARIGRRLRLAQIIENVTVYAKAPAAPPSAPPQSTRRPALPVVVPIAPAEMESICLPAKRDAATESIATIQSHRHEAGRTLYHKGDELNIDGGTLRGLAVGRNLVARRYFRAHDRQDVAGSGEQAAGVVQIVSVRPQSSTAVVVHACNELMAGDFLAAFTPTPKRTPEPGGEPVFADAIPILFAEAGHLLGSPQRLMVIERGSGHGVDLGQRLTIFRSVSPGLPPFVVGEAVVVDLRADSATIRVERAIDAINLGDWAARQTRAKN